MPSIRMAGANALPSILPQYDHPIDGLSILPGDPS
jgi:hypothetical protein